MKGVEKGQAGYGVVSRSAWSIGRDGSNHHLWPERAEGSARGSTVVSGQWEGAVTAIDRPANTLQARQPDQ